MAKTVLVINSGSSSIKYQLVDLETGEGIASGLVEKIGEPVDGHYKHEYNGEKHELEEPIHDHEQGLKRVLGFFDEFGPKLADAGIVAVGHRVVQGGSIFPKPALVNDKTIGQVKDLAVLAPLHNGPEAKGNDVAGHVNVFVFPDLCSGNIGYKAVQRSSGALAIGPVLQGLNKPVNDLSRGATVQDIINTIALTAIEAQ